MATNPEVDRNGAGGRRITLSARALAALDGLAPTERAAVAAVLVTLEQAPDERAEPRLQRIDAPGGPDLYVLRPTERVRLVLRFAPDGAGEVLEVVRPETLRRLFAAPVAEPA
jgi:hypothetical protein